MKLAECKVGMYVWDRETEKVYKVVGNRVLATDCGADLADAQGYVGVAHWSRLVPVDDGTKED
jgi:hypothetical protein